MGKNLTPGDLNDCEFQDYDNDYEILVCEKLGKIGLCNKFNCPLLRDANKLKKGEED